MNSQISMFSAEGSHASHIVRPGSEQARKMTVTSGRKCIGSWLPSGPLGYCLRTLLGSSHWASTTCLLTWKAQATPAGRLLFRLSPSTPRTEETESGLWATASARDWKDTPGMAKTGVNPDGSERKREDQLAQQVYSSLLPTPSVACAEGGQTSRSGDRKGEMLLGGIARAMDAGLWPTPTIDGNHSNKELSPKAGDGLSTAVKRSMSTHIAATEAVVPSPINATETIAGSPSIPENSGDMYPTPNSTDHKGAGQLGRRPRHDDDLPSRVARDLLPTPTESMRTVGDMEQARFAGDDPNRPTYEEASKKIWPTPKETPSGPDYARVNREGSGGDDLATAVAKMYPTMDEGAAKGRGQASADQRHRLGGSLNPTWVEWLMGFPIGWTVSRPSETPSSRP